MRANLLFMLLVAAAGGIGYFGVTWSSARTPAPALVATAAPAEPAKPAPAAMETADKNRRETVNNSKPNKGDTDRERDALRLELLQAANAYALSPCSDVMKTNLKAALTAYASAMADKMGCVSFFCSGGARVDAGADLFSTPLDKRARSAVGEAFEKGGISVQEFPASLRLALVMIAGEQGSSQPACSTTATTAQRRR